MNRIATGFHITGSVSRWRQQGAVLVFSLLLLLVLTVLGVSGIGNSVLEERMSGNFQQSTTALQAAEAAVRVAEDWLTDRAGEALTSPNRLDSNNFLHSLETGYSTSDDWFTNAAGKKSGLYSTQTAPAVYGTCGVVTDPNCSNDTSDPSYIFDPTDEDHWCAAPAGCIQLVKGSVLLGSNDLNTGVLPALDIVSRQPRFVIEYIGRSGEYIGSINMDETNAPDIRRYSFRITAIGFGSDANSRHVVQSSFILPL